MDTGNALDRVIELDDDDGANALVLQMAAPIVAQTLTLDAQRQAAWSALQDAQTRAEIVAIIERFSDDIGYRFIVRTLRGWSYDRAVGR